MCQWWWLLRYAWYAKWCSYQCHYKLNSVILGWSITNVTYWIATQTQRAAIPEIFIKSCPPVSFNTWIPGSFKFWGFFVAAPDTNVQTFYQANLVMTNGVISKPTDIAKSNFRLLVDILHSERVAQFGPCVGHWMDNLTTVTHTKKNLTFYNISTDNEVCRWILLLNFCINFDTPAPSLTWSTNLGMSCNMNTVLAIWVSINLVPLNMCFNSPLMLSNTKQLCAKRGPRVHTISDKCRR